VAALRADRATSKVDAAELTLQAGAKGLMFSGR
jgi:hypothetical protein